MAKPRPDRWNPSQIVAHNMTQARELRGLTQTEVADRLSRFTDAKWTKTSVAQAEGSVSGSRIRVFTAVELVALARTFDLPVLYFLAPPVDAAVELDLPGAPADAWDYLVSLLVGHRENFAEYSERFADYAGSALVSVPDGDIHGEHLSDYLSGHLRDHERFSATDIWAAGMFGAMEKNLKAQVFLGSNVREMAQALRQMADVLEVFDGYQPSELLNVDLAEDVARWRTDKRRAERAAFEGEEDRA